MPDISNSNWSERDDQNAEVAPLGFPPGLPAQIELIGRMMMGAIKRFWTRTNPYYLTGGTADNYTLKPSSQPSTIALYELINARIDRANVSTTPTFAYGKTTARTIVKFVASGKVPLVIGDLVAGNDHSFWFDGTNWILTNPATVDVSLVVNGMSKAVYDPTAKNQDIFAYTDTAAALKLAKAANLSDLASATTAVANLGFTHGANVASAATINLDAATGNYVDITGTTTVTAVTLADGKQRFGRCTAGFSVTASATLVFNGNTSGTYVVAIDDILLFEGYGASTVRVWRIGGNLLPVVHQQYFTSSGTFTTPANSTISTIYKYIVTAGGGGSGGATSGANAGGGGGAGQTSMGTFTGLAPSTAVTITIGTGGTAGANTGTSGGTGVTSSISASGITTVNATGGSGGVGSTSGGNAGGIGGTGGTGGTLSVPGGGGGASFGSAGAAFAVGGMGGSSYWGGGPVVTTNGPGQTGTAYGSGASGASGTGAAQVGGVGAPGVAVIEWVL